jgi:hypothetical protein
VLDNSKKKKEKYGGSGQESRKIVLTENETREQVPCF